MRNIQQVLERWGGWAASEGGSVYFPPVAAGFKNLLPATQSGRLKCSDNDGLIINSAMSCLKKKIRICARSLSGITSMPCPCGRWVRSSAYLTPTF